MEWAHCACQDQHSAQSIWVQERNAYWFSPKMEREFKRPAPLVLLILAILGWSAAALAFWHRSDGQELQQPAPVVRSEDQDKSLTEISTTQKKLAKAQSALSMISDCGMRQLKHFRKSGTDPRR
jgi:hypothetical protein